MSNDNPQIQPQMTRQDILDIVDNVDDDLVIQIIDTGATKQELLEAITWLSGDEEVLATALDREPSGRVAQLCDILSTSALGEEER